MRSLALVTVLALSLAACGGGSGGAVPTGTLKLSVTDAPFPVDLVASASVVIKRVEARNADAGGWQVLFDGDAVPEPDPDAPADAPPPEPVGYAEIDLVPLTGGVSELLVEIQVPVGTYDEVRLIVDAGEVVLEPDAYVASGASYPESHTFNTELGNLAFPSGAQTGIKVKIQNDIVVSSQLSADLTLDFDLATNFVFNGTPEHAPGVKGVSFTPVVRAMNTTTNGTVVLQALSDEGTDDPADDVFLPNPTVDVYAVTTDDVTGDPVETWVTTVSGADDGTLAVSLLPGTYAFDVSKRGYEPARVDGIVVVLGNVTDAGTVTLAVAAFWLDGQVLSDMGTPEDDDQPLEGATVKLWTPDLDPDVDAAVAETSTDTAGRWTVTGLLPGTFFVRIAADGHATADFADVAVDAGIPASLDVTLVATP